MTFLAQVVDWFRDPAHWSGPGSIPLRAWEHVSLSAVSLGLAIAIALPLGLWIGHTNRGARLAIGIANVGRAVPSIGWLGIALPITLALFQRGGLGFLPSTAALVALGIPPIVTNTYAGLRDVDPEMIEAGRGMGMRELELLRRVEVPIALPVIMAGIRSSAVAIVATATLAALVGGGTLGDFILQGLYVNDQPRIVGAAILVAILALGTELCFGALERVSVSAGMRGGGNAVAKRGAAAS